MVRTRSRSRSRSRRRSRSRSRSGSRSPKERIDRFGRVIPPERTKSSRSRSRSGSRSRRGLRRSRSPMRRYNRRSRSRSRSDSRSGRFPRDHRAEHRSDRSDRPDRRHYDQDRHDRFERERPQQNMTNIEDPQFLNARLFIGNLPSTKVTKEELENLFNVYGKILGVSIHDRGFGFIQFEKEEDALKAKEGENGTKLKGSVLDVKMAAEGRRQGAGRGAGRGRDFDRDSGSGGFPPGRGPPPGRDRSPVRGDPYEDRYRDPYRPPPGPPGPPGRDGAAERPGAAPYPPRDDPYFREDPYRRPPPPPVDDPYRDPYRDDPYRRDAPPPPPPPFRRDPYDDPYRDPYFRDPYYPPPPKKPMPADVQVICMNKNLTTYAENIESRLRQHAMIVDIVVIQEDLSVPQMVEEAARMKFLFAIAVNSQNEAHKSLTLNILHGTPQEHRNMPLDDAVKLVSSSFDKYIQTQKEKTAQAAGAGPSAVPGGPAPPFVPPSTDISYLLNLLADNRQLTVEEIDKVLEYLKERKSKLLVAEGKPPEGVPRPSGSAGAVPAPGGGDSMSSSSSVYLQQQQQEIQSKILNILNGSGSSTSSSLSTATQAVSAQGYGRGMGGPGGQHGARQQQSQSGANPMINLDNPSVQKALDSLIQSGPSLLKSLPSSMAPQQAPPRNQFAGQGQQAATHYASQPPAPPQAPQQQPPQMGYNQYQQYPPQTAQGALRGQQPASYGGQQGARPMMGVRPPTQQPGVRPRY